MKLDLSIQSHCGLKTVIAVVLLCLGMALPTYLPVAAYSWQEPVDVPTWVTGDTWKYWTVNHDVFSETQDVKDPLFGKLGTVTLTYKYLSDNTTYKVLAGTTQTNGYTTYKMSINGLSAFSGTYHYIDTSGFTSDEDGCFSGTQTSTGTQYKQVSDQAFVKADLSAAQTVNFYDGCGATLSPQFGSANGQGTSVADADPPLNDLMFPLKTNLEWDTTSTVTTTTTPQGGTATQSIIEYDFHNKVNGTKSHSVAAGDFNAFEIHESGTKTRDGNIKALDQSAYYAPDVKNFIDKTQDNEKLMSFTVHFYADLSVIPLNISVDPASPVQGLAAKVNATIWNKGDEDANNFQAELWAGTTKIGTVDVASVKAKKSANISFDWTPSASGNIDLDVVLDPSNTIQEYTKANNSAKITVTVTTPRADLAIAASDITVPGQVPIVSNQPIKAKVHNNGNKAASKVVVRFLDGSSKIGKDVTFDSVDQGATVEATTVWNPTTIGSHTINVNVDPDGNITEISKNNNQASVNVNVVQLNYSFSLNTALNHADAKPNETVQFQLTLKNTGKKQDIIGLIVSPPPTGWVVNLDKTSVNLASGGAVPLVLTMTSPVGTAAGTNGSVLVQATSQGDSNYKLYQPIWIKIKQVPGVKFQLKTATKDMVGIPGATVTYQFSVENSGNSNDTFALSVETQKQWTTTIEGSTSTGQLAQGGKKTITLKTTIPTTTLAADKEVVTLVAKSEFDTNYQQTAIATITCLQVFDLSASVTPPTLAVNPGDSATFTIKLTNDGNGDDIVNTSLKGSPDIPQDWTLTYDEKTTVRAGKEKDVLVTIQVPKTAAAQDYSITIQIVGGSGDKIQKPVTLTVKQTYDLTVTALPVNAEVKAGKTVVFQVTVKNNGNGEDTVDMSVDNLDPALTATFSETEFKVKPGASHDVTLTITVKSSASGSKPVVVKGTSKDGKVSSTANLGLTVKAIQQQNNNMMLYILVIVIIAGVLGVVAVIWYRRTH